MLRTLIFLTATFATSIAAMSVQPPPNVAGKWTFVSGWSMTMSDGKPVKTEVTRPAGPLGPTGTIALDDRQLTFTPASADIAKTTCNLFRTGASPGDRAATGCIGTTNEKNIRLTGMQRSVNGSMTVSLTQLSLDADGRLVVLFTGPSELGHPGPVGTLIYQR